MQKILNWSMVINYPHNQLQFRYRKLREIHVFHDIRREKAKGEEYLFLLYANF